jgi:hypothetical protein
MEKKEKERGRGRGEGLGPLVNKKVKKLGDMKAKKKIFNKRKRQEYIR